MNAFKVLILECDGRRQLTDDLERILRSGGGNQLELRRQLAGQPNPCDIPAAANPNRVTFVPDVVLIVMAPGCHSARAAAPARYPDALRTTCGAAPVIAVLATEDPQEIAAMLQAGIDDYLVPPLRAADVLPRLWRCAQKHREQQLPAVPRHAAGLKQLVGESRPLLAVIKRIEAAARCDANVLICGETGTGKEITARAIHSLSARSGKPFVALNCAGVQPEILENDLFGHVAGAYTSANSTASGLVQQADDGTLFLDEVDSALLSVQAKLLRFTDHKDIRQVGSGNFRSANVRIIAATNADLEQAIRAKLFRGDLLYRLDVIRITLPALRERADDIPSLARHFLVELGQQSARLAKTITAAALQKLALYHWPGNVRQLKHIIERAVANSQEAVLDADDMDLPLTTMARNFGHFRLEKATTIAAFERKYLNELLTASGGNAALGARTAGMHVSALWAALRKYGIRPQKRPPPAQ